MDVCGRFTFIFYTEFFSRFALHARKAEIESRYNIAPTHDVRFNVVQAETMSSQNVNQGFQSVIADNPLTGGSSIEVDHIHDA